MTFNRPTHVQHPQNRAEKPCPKQPLNVTLAQASALPCDGAGFKQLLLQLQFTHQLPSFPEVLHLTAKDPDAVASMNGRGAHNLRAFMKQP
jgi:hypothetical protein